LARFEKYGGVISGLAAIPIRNAKSRVTSEGVHHSSVIARLVGAQGLKSRLKASALAKSFSFALFFAADENPAQRPPLSLTNALERFGCYGRPPPGHRTHPARRKPSARPHVS
jgi:hypothetical protein